MQTNYGFSLQSTLNGDMVLAHSETCPLHQLRVVMCFCPSVPASKQSWSWHSATHESYDVLWLKQATAQTNVRKGGDKLSRHMQDT